MKKIPLQNSSLETSVDDEDFELLSENRWRISPRGYVYRYEQVAGQSKTLLMHRVVLNAPKGIGVDHRELPRYNNQKHNLRLATQSQNGANARVSLRPKTSRYKGVWWSRHRGRWVAELMLHRKKIHLGVFLKEEEAAAAYNQGAQQRFGQFAHLNQIDK